MLRRTAIGLVAASLIGATAIPTGALASGHGGGHGGFAGGFGHGAFGGGGFARSFGGGGVARSFGGPAIAGAPHTFAGQGFVRRGFAPGFHGHRFARLGVPFALGLGLGYGGYPYYYDDPCYAWTPSGYAWVCGYDY